ncbi:MAG: DUF2314 domain-containing protein [Leptospiraceae bacterium]|nr:DUF2314 domain-containing protein [Leptospiraceae bacterium]
MLNPKFPCGPGHTLRNFLRSILLVLALPLSASILAEAPDDADLAAAVEKARATLPHFWNTLANPTANQESFMIKVRIVDASATEDFWCGRIHKEAELVRCTIANEPKKVQSVSFGQEISPKSTQIVDWMYRDNGYIHGNYTMRALIKRMPSEKAEFYRSMLADPE